jgi:hypothetical protein
MQLKGFISLFAVVIAVLLVGCSGSDSGMTDAQIAALRNPPKGGGMPPQAAEAMAKGMAQMKKQNEGLDSRGVPLAQSTLGNAGAPGVPPAQK